MKVTYLVTAHLLGDVVQRLNDSQPQLLALLIFGNSNVFDMTHKAEVVDTIIVVSIPFATCTVVFVTKQCSPVLLFHRLSDL